MVNAKTLPFFTAFLACLIGCRTFPLYRKHGAYDKECQHDTCAAESIPSNCLRMDTSKTGYSGLNCPFCRMEIELLIPTVIAAIWTAYLCNNRSV